MMKWIKKYLWEVLDLYVLLVIDLIGAVVLFLFMLFGAVFYLFKIVLVFLFILFVPFIAIFSFVKGVIKWKLQEFI